MTPLNSISIMASALILSACAIVSPYPNTVALDDYHRLAQRQHCGKTPQAMQALLSSQASVKRDANAPQTRVVRYAGDDSTTRLQFHNHQLAEVRHAWHAFPQLTSGYAQLLPLDCRQSVQYFPISEVNAQ